MTARTTRRSAGFALIEVVISLALFALIMALLQATFFTGGQMMRAAGSRGSPAGDLIITNRILERWIGSATIDPARGRGFAGTSDTIRFHAQLDGETGPALFLVTLAIRRGAAGDATLVGERRMPDDPASTAERTVLLNWSGPLGFRFAGTGDRSWTDSFAEDGQLPSKVRLVAAAGPLVTVRVSSEENLHCLVTADVEKIQRRECRVR